MTDLQQVVSMLHSESEEDRLLGLKELAEFKTEAFLDHVYRALGDASWRIRKEAVDLFLSQPRAAEFLEEVIALLYSEDNPGLRNAAVDILINFGSRAVSPLIAELESDDGGVRKFALDILGEIRDSSCVPAMIAALGDPDDNVRAAAAENLGKIGAPEAVPALLEALERPDLWFRFTILDALGRIGDGVPVGALLAFKDEKLLRKALFACLGRIGGAEAILALIQGLTDTMRNVREASTVGLGQLAERHPEEVAEELSHAVDDHLIASLIDLLGCQNQAVRGAAVRLCDCIPDERFIEPLLFLMEDEEIRELALAALVSLGRSKLEALLKFWPRADERMKPYLACVFGELGAETSIEALIEGVNSADSLLRLVSVQALGRLESPTAMRQLVDCLREESEEIREAATKALCRLGSRHREKLGEDLAPLLESGNAELRRCAIRIFSSIGGEKADEALAMGLKDESPLVRRTAIRGLAVGKGGERLLAVMLALTDEDAEVRRSAVEALGVIGENQAFPPLQLALQDEDIWVRAAAIRALGQIGGGEAETLVQQGLQDPVGLVAIAALETLSLLDGQKAFPMGLKALEHGDADVVIAALQMLSGSGRREWIPAVRDQLLNHPQGKVRSAFALTLVRVEGQGCGPYLEDRLLREEENLVRQQLQSLLDVLKDRQG